MIQQVCDSAFPWCPADAKTGELYKLRVKDLSPRQFAVDDVDYPAAETPRSIYGISKEKGRRLVVAPDHIP